MPAVGFSLRRRGYHVRSISLPALRSSPRHDHHRLIDKNVKNVDEMRAAFSVLVNLYNYIDQLLAMPLTLQTFTRHRRDTWIDDWLDESVLFLDACAATREAVLLLHSSLRRAQSVLRRTALDPPPPTTEVDHVAACVASLKKLKKETNKATLAALKVMSGEGPTWAPPPGVVEGRHAAEVVRMMREASVASKSVFRSALVCLFGGSVRAAAKGGRWPAALVSKVLAVQGREMKESDRHQAEEVEVVVNSCLVVLQRLSCRNNQKDLGEEEEEEEERVIIKRVCERLEGLERSLEGVEKEMESLFRCLIHTRVSFLNVLSH